MINCAHKLSVWRRLIRVIYCRCKEFALLLGGFIEGGEKKKK